MKRDENSRGKESRHQHSTRHHHHLQREKRNDKPRGSRTDVEKSAKTSIESRQNLLHSRDVLMAVETSIKRREIIQRAFLLINHFLIKFSADISRSADYVTSLFGGNCV